MIKLVPMASELETARANPMYLSSTIMWQDNVNVKAKERRHGPA
jgi:hypothetical protein